MDEVVLTGRLIALTCVLGVYVLAHYGGLQVHALNVFRLADVKLAEVFVHMDWLLQLA